MIGLFWILSALVIYTYLGYPFALALLSRLREWKVQKKGFEPTVSIMMSAANEETNIERKLVNLLNLHYPEEKIEILVGSDGASDKTDEIISRFQSPRIRFFRFVSKQGKPHVLNALAREAKGKILVFTDARQEFKRTAVKNLVENFYDVDVGCVSGELLFREVSGGISKGMDIYWRYEKFLRNCESNIDSMLGATGAIYAVRKCLYSAMPEDILVDDMYLPISIICKGYRAVFDRTAIAYDIPSTEERQERKRKVRTLAGNYQIVRLFPDLINPLNNRIAWQFISHKLMRLMVPFILIGVFVSNLFLAHHLFYAIALILQIVFYSLAGLGLFIERAKKTCPRQIRKIVSLPFSFCVLNYSALVAFYYCVVKKQSVIWERAYAKQN